MQLSKISSQCSIEMTKFQLGFRNSDKRRIDKPFRSSRQLRR